MSKSRLKNKIPIRTLLILIFIAALILAWFLWGARYYEANKVKHKLSGELDKLSQPLGKMGFSGRAIQSACQTGRLGSQICTASTSSYVVYKSNLSSLPADARQLSGLLDKNGWQQRKDYPTISWFTKISQKVDYQPDQLNVKQAGGYYCTLDFFTSFSKPAAPAVTMEAFCSKGKPPFGPID